MQNTDSAEIDRLIAELEHADYSQATEPCDLLMKGGVTSGVVYPTTICRLAETFRLRNIGGTSAGALASALAAAAEYERATTLAADPTAKPKGYQRLAAVPAFLGQDANLEKLFQPSKGTAPLFRIFLTLIDAKKSGFVKAAAPFVEFRVATGVSALIALLLFAVNLGLGGLSSVSGLGYVLAAFALVVTFLLLAVGAIAFSLRRIVLVKIPDNEFGMCTGLDTLGPPWPAPLTPWLADRIDEVAGVTGTDKSPLTFGDLYGVRPPGESYPYPSQTGSPVLDDLNARHFRDVNLEMVTTDVTAGRPYRLPFSPTGGTQFFYDEDDLKRFFPQRVTERMKRGATPLPLLVTDLVEAKPGRDGRPLRSQTRAEKGARKLLYPFPSAENLPVVVAARMSMSFPILFSAVPLYAVNRVALAAAHDDPSESRYDKLEVRKTWFSDGGLSSNIPIHFFDGPVPRWPTFALNLRGFPRTSGGVEKPLDAETATDRDKVFLATAYDPDVELFRTTGTGRLFQFANSLIDAMQNWNDTTLLRLPGYRERTVEIAMLDSEGGLNLVMPKETISSIMLRGYYAADEFKRLFATPTLSASDHWNNHRHIRLRSSLLMQSEWTRRFATAWNAPGLVPPYAEILGGINPPYDYPYAPGEIASAQRFAKQLADAPGTIDAGVTLTSDPNPAPELRARPRV